MQKCFNSCRMQICLFSACISVKRDKTAMPRVSISVFYRLLYSKSIIDYRPSFVRFCTCEAAGNAGSTSPGSRHAATTDEYCRAIGRCSAPATLSMARSLVQLNNDDTQTDRQRDCPLRRRAICMYTLNDRLWEEPRSRPVGSVTRE